VKYSIYTNKTKKKLYKNIKKVKKSIEKAHLENSKSTDEVKWLDNEEENKI
jgi:hypothetical protein